MDLTFICSKLIIWSVIVFNVVGFLDVTPGGVTSKNPTTLYSITPNYDGGTKSQYLCFG